MNQPEGQSTSADSLVPSITLCDGCGPPRSLLYINSSHGDDVELSVNLTHESGRTYSETIQLDSGVYSLHFDDAYNAGFDVTVSTNDADLLGFRIYDLCCESELLLLVRASTTVDETLQLLAEFENEETYFLPKVLQLPERASGGSPPFVADY